MTTQFGINISTSAGSGSDPLTDAQRAEELGFDFISSSDHPIGANPSNETWTQLAMIAASTSRIRVAPRVLGAPFRNPALLAKMAETLDRLSGGRLILGLGAGGMDQEVEALGASPTGAGAKITALEEAIQIIHGLWRQPDFTFAGDHFRTNSATITPRPAATIPIWLGTFGARSLEVTGRLADGWIPSLGHAGADKLQGMLQRVRRSQRKARRADDMVQCILNVQVEVGGAPGGDAIGGTPAEVANQLAEYIAMGFGGFNFMPPEDDWPGQAQLLAREVIPVLGRS